jgi:NADPH2:quinone reductase
MGEREALQVVIDRQGAPEVMRFQTVKLEAPSQGQVLLRHEAIGLNFVDVYFRRGDKKVEDFPFVNGFEGAGIVEEVGASSRWRPGDRVVHLLEPGAYATRRYLRADRAIGVPEWMSNETAAAAFLKGLTAEYLIRRHYRVGPRDVVLVHAAAGGVGSLMTQWACALGARVFGTVGSPAKRAAALSQGCEDAFVTGSQDWVEAFKDATAGRGATVVYDGVGRSTFYGSLEVLRVRGSLVAFGSASGNPKPLDVARLNERSIVLSNPGVQHFVRTRAELEGASRRLFGALEKEIVRLPPVTRFNLTEVVEAHRALETRETSGAAILVP